MHAVKRGGRRRTTTCARSGLCVQKASLASCSSTAACAQRDRRQAGLGAKGGRCRKSERERTHALVADARGPSGGLRRAEERLPDRALRLEGAHQLVRVRERHDRGREVRTASAARRFSSTRCSMAFKLGKRDVSASPGCARRRAASARAARRADPQEREREREERRRTSGSYPSLASRRPVTGLFPSSTVRRTPSSSPMTPARAAPPSPSHSARSMRATTSRANHCWAEWVRRAAPTLRGWPEKSLMICSPSQRRWS